MEGKENFLAMFGKENRNDGYKVVKKFYDI